MIPLQERPQLFVIPSKLTALCAITFVFSLPQYTQLWQLVVSLCFKVALSEKKDLERISFDCVCVHAT
jgi:hypothetical protein